jgi:hypothetical protein
MAGNIIAARLGSGWSRFYEPSLETGRRPPSIGRLFGNCIKTVIFIIPMPQTKFRNQTSCGQIGSSQMFLGIAQFCETLASSSAFFILKLKFAKPAVELAKTGSEIRYTPTHPRARPPHPPIHSQGRSTAASGSESLVVAAAASIDSSRPSDRNSRR